MSAARSRTGLPARSASPADRGAAPQVLAAGNAEPPGDRAAADRSPPESIEVCGLQRGGRTHTAGAGLPARPPCPPLLDRVPSQLPVERAKSRLMSGRCPATGRGNPWQGAAEQLSGGRPGSPRADRRARADAVPPLAPIVPVLVQQQVRPAHLAVLNASTARSVRRQADTNAAGACIECGAGDHSRSARPLIR